MIGVVLGDLAGCAAGQEARPHLSAAVGCRDEGYNFSVRRYRRLLFQTHRVRDVLELDIGSCDLPGGGQPPAARGHAGCKCDQRRRSH